MRKHLYLITEHERDERIGRVSVMDSRLSRPEKNTEAPLRIYDEEEGDFRVAGKRVGLGYHDFEDDDPDDETFAEIIQSKIRSVDREWAEKADIEDVYDDGGDE